MWGAVSCIQFLPLWDQLLLPGQGKGGCTAVVSCAWSQLLWHMGVPHGCSELCSASATLGSAAQAWGRSRVCSLCAWLPCLWFPFQPLWFPLLWPEWWWGGRFSHQCMELWSSAPWLRPGKPLSLQGVVPRLGCSGLYCSGLGFFPHHCSELHPVSASPAWVGEGRVSHQYNELCLLSDALGSADLAWEPPTPLPSLQ